MVVGYSIDIEFSWGFQSRIVGLSKTSPSFYYPPPSTFLGALAEAIAKSENLNNKQGLGLMAALSRSLLAIGWRPLNCVVLKYEDINRLIKIGIAKGILTPDPRFLGDSFDSPARGKTVVISLDENSPTIRWTLVFRKNNIPLEKDISIELNEESFWRIHRLGSKESVISVVNVKKFDQITALTGLISIKNSFFVKEGVTPKEEAKGRWNYEVYLNPFDLEAYRPEKNPFNYYMMGEKLLSFKIPILSLALYEPEYLVELRHPFVAYKCGEGVVVGRT